MFWCQLLFQSVGSERAERTSSISTLRKKIKASTWADSILYVYVPLETVTAHHQTLTKLQALNARTE